MASIVKRWGLVLLPALYWYSSIHAFSVTSMVQSTKSSSRNPRQPTLLQSDKNDEAEEEAFRLKSKADALRDQIREMEATLGDKRGRDYYTPTTTEDAPQEELGMSLKNKKVLVVGANGRLGSMVTRYLLRNFPEVGEVVAAVHYVGEASTRGYGRLSYEVGAEDGVGSIGAAWSEERDATFQFSDEMKSYNLQNLRVVEVELLDPLQCMTITEDIDCVIWCATDFNGNTPRAISGLNAAFLFRAFASPTKGRVEIEGLTNMLGALKQSKQNKNRVSQMAGDDFSKMNSNSPTSFILVSSAPNALNDFETPFGEFNGLKRQGEGIVRKDFPSLTHTILQMGCFEDNFVEESLDINYSEGDDSDQEEKLKRKINRRDAARAACEALVNEDLQGKTVEVWTALK